MSELSTRYNFKDVESKWLKIWEEQNAFAATPNSGKPPYTIVIPPPNVTGILHMGHALNNTLQDIIIRYKRMKGFEALWVVGTDHAGIATQNVVERALAQEGKTRHDIGREEMLKRLWAWKKEYGDTIINQLVKLGASCYYEKKRFTMDDEYSLAVRKVFVDLYKKDLVYQGKYIINWCPRCHTALSDEEAEHQEHQGKIWHFKYPFKDNPSEGVVVATTRPETMLGDTAVAVNPDDDRYKDVIGKTVILPLLNREIKIIADDYVDPEFGSGAVKVTPAHDPNDFAMGQRHELEFINIMDESAVLNENAGQFNGLSREDGRKEVVKEMKAEGFLVKVDDHQHAVGHCYRCDTVVEPYLSKQWFVKMEPLAKPAAQCVRDGKLKIQPQRWEKVYLNWLDGIRDWCISRQIWWGHQIPVWHKRINLTEDNWHDELMNWGWDSYLENKLCSTTSGNSQEEKPIIIRVFRDGELFDYKKDPLTPVVPDTEGVYDFYVCTAYPEVWGPDFEKVGFVQDPDVLDTWFSSWLWPFATIGWPEETEELKYFYPTSSLFTASEIIFFWVARMVMAGYEFMGNLPFTDVFIHGTVRDSKGLKMSKSLGNSIDPLDIIKDYGADALRFSLIINSGQDILISKEKFEIGRNFCNKVWNATRLVLMNISDDAKIDDISSINIEELDMPSKWIVSHYYTTLEKVEQFIEQFKYSEAEEAIYEFFWNNYCDWYLEIIKSRFDDANVSKVAFVILQNTLKMMHPFIPFATEEIYSQLKDQQEILTKGSWPEAQPNLINENIEAEMATLIDLITNIRNVRAQWNVGHKEKVDIVFAPENQDLSSLLENNMTEIKRLSTLNEATVNGQTDQLKGAAAGVVKGIKFFIPLGDVIDIEKEKKRISGQIDQISKSLDGLTKRLSNESFLSKAPEDIVAKEKERQDQMTQQISELKSVLENLS